MPDPKPVGALRATLVSVEPPTGLLRRHPLSALWPDPSADELKALDESMDKFGFQPNHPVVLYDDQVLDGWQRYTRAREHNLTPTFVRLGGDDPASYVVSAHSARRHLKPHQLADLTVLCFSWRKPGRPSLGGGTDHAAPQRGGATGSAAAAPAAGAGKTGSNEPFISSSPKPPVPAPSRQTAIPDPQDLQDAKPAASSKQMADAAGVSLSTIKRAKKRAVGKPAAPRAKVQRRDPDEEGEPPQTALPRLVKDGKVVQASPPFVDWYTAPAPDWSAVPACPDKPPVGIAEDKFRPVRQAAAVYRKRVVDTLAELERGRAELAKMMREAGIAGGAK